MTPKVAEDSLTMTLRNEIDLIERHIRILDVVIREAPIGVIRLSKETGLPDHRIRYSLRMLEREGLVQPTQEGAVYTKEAKRIFPQLKVILLNLGDRLSTVAKQLEEERRKVK